MDPWGPLGLFRSHSEWEAVSIGLLLRKEATEMVQNASKTVQLERLSSLVPKNVQNGTQSGHLEHLGGVGFEMVPR